MHNVWVPVLQHLHVGFMVATWNGAKCKPSRQIQIHILLSLKRYKAQGVVLSL